MKKSEKFSKLEILRKFSKSQNQPTNQYINQTINQSIDQSINQLIDQLSENFQSQNFSKIF